ncbi:site-specific integrase [Streptomyces sp. NBC_00057]|uniref:site-specific integrase n=1 Tax=Streptomyces sp. NBC_00057 TaxID=2975634 RepID=UPI00324D91A0
MSTIPQTAVLSPGTAASPFVEADMCGLAGFVLPIGAARPVFEDDTWDFTQVIGIPAYVSKCARRLDFSGIINVRWKTVAKEYIAAQMAPGHEAVRTLPYANRTVRVVNGLYTELLELVRWLNWLTTQGVAELGEVTDHHCKSFAQYRATHRPAGKRTHDRPSVRRAVELTIIGLARYSELFTTDRYHPGLRPFRGQATSKPSGNANKTPPVTDPTFQPLLAAALYLVQTLAPPLLRELDAKRRYVAHRAALPAARIDLEELEAIIRRHVEEQRPFDRNVSWAKTRTWISKDDPLSQINLYALAAEGGRREISPSALESVRDVLEEAVKAVGIEEPFCRGASMVKRADGQGEVPWSEPLSERGLRALTGVVKTASHVVIVALSGMRQSELREMNVGCRVPPIEAGPGLKRYKLASRVVKGKPLGGVPDEWVVIWEAYQAAEVAEQLLGPEAEIGDPLLTSPLDRSRFALFRQWVNGPAGQALGLAPIPEGQLTARMLRRTLALEIAYRPGGLLAAKVQLKHVSVVTTEGYAARPGGAQAKFLAEVNAEEAERNKDLVLAEYRRYQQGEMPSGPGARDLISFFASVDGKLARAAAEDATVVGSDQEVRALLAEVAGVLHLGVANYCWFIDPSKALCLKLAGTPNATKPLAGMCDSARCPQATHHPCHRPVWAESVRTKQVFIGSIGRNHKTEKARLQADLDRDVKVLASIAAAAS